MLHKLEKQAFTASIGRARALRGATLAILAAGVTVIGSALPQAAQASMTVATTVGTFSSITSSTNSSVQVFEGIRYAAAPEKTLRWQPPTAPTPPTGTVSADKFGDACPQSESTTPISQSEDCLFLNVWSPTSVTATSKLPVFLWIHGGALTFGTGATYNPSTMVNDGQIIVVTINYRLGALGFLCEPSLDATSASFFQNTGDCGNYGIMDQQFALQWVQNNIAAFGGDPTKVTVGGESAGGLSTTVHLTSTTTAKGLFRAAIIESGGYMLNDLPSQSTYTSKFGKTFETDAGLSADTATKLQALSVETILTAQEEAFGAAGISPDFGTKIVPSALASALSSGAFIQVPVLQGSNANEGRLFEPLIFEEEQPTLNANSVDNAGGPANFDLANANTFCASNGKNEKCTYPQEISLFVGLLGIVPASANTSSFESTLASDYPLANFPDPFLKNNAPSSDEALSQIFTDAEFACNIFESYSLLSSTVTVYAYEFNDPLAPPEEGSNTAIKAPNDVDGFPTASEHASELQFLFTLTGIKSTLSADEEQLETTMQGYWSNFVVNGNPNIAASANSPSVASWPVFNTSTNMVQQLVPGPSNPSPFTTFSSEHFCSVWNPIIQSEAQE